MDKKLRCEIVRAMDLIARTINDEEVFETWLIWGVADGDIAEDTTDEELECYIEDEEFAGLMNTFTRIMQDARMSGGLYADGIVSKKEEYIDE